jgi:hypothetical protein
MKITPQGLWSNFELSTALLWIVWTKNKFTGYPCVIHRELWTKLEIVWNMLDHKSEVVEKIEHPGLFTSGMF